MNKTPELLLPAGNMEMCLAAIHNGANAIYVGMPEFNARGRSSDHSFEQLKEIIDTCHLYNVKVHIAFNVLIFEEELTKAKELITKLIPLNPDAIIVQDLGLVRLIKSMAPNQVIHASTQMTVTNELAIELTKDLDIERYVLGRENSLSEIKKMKDHTDKELEVFVHGALCVAYSGQCFTSESIGGRSANRGQCAQSCRFEYDLIVDGQKQNLVDRNYLVSPKDLCGINEIDSLAQLGVDSLKVEGRLKSPQFVASVARSYRKALDDSKAPKQDLINEMAITYSRGFFPGWLHGVDHQQLVDGHYGSNRGLKVGQVLELRKNSITIGSDIKIHKGDGVLFNSTTDRNLKEIGTKVYEVFPFRNNRYELRFSKDFKIDKVAIGSDIYINSSPGLTKELTKSYSDKNYLKKLEIEVKLFAVVGQELILEYRYNDKIVSSKSEDKLELAQKTLDIDKVKKEVSSLGATIFNASKITIETESSSPFIPNKVLKGLRQQNSQKLLELLSQKREQEVRDFDLNPIQVVSSVKTSKFRILLRDIEQVRSFTEKLMEQLELKTYLDSIILDFEYGKDYQESVDILKAAGIESAIATNRILKPGEYHHLKSIIRIAPDYILARNLGSMQFIKENSSKTRVAGDFSLNISNSLTSDYLFNKGFETLTPSYDLNEQQLLSLIEHSSNKNFEVTIHQYMPSFHMEHCVYAAFLSKGSSFKDCGKPCEKHKVELHDQFGNKHFIKADQECRNTMYNATSIGAASLITKSNLLGVSLFRIEALHEEGSVIFEKFKLYIEHILGNISIEDLNNSLGQQESYGLSSGQLFKSDDYQDRKKN
ncbi:U32 family peptidase [Halobacteriovorax sp. HLS]|uniref:U32 family peptidase n=1 Tax=Halobacteriovorax sp. HLS TaxID=2234000 RepID=UPI000FD92F8D|nr:U32 family peptidase [Halobacteriovorax sp. HLS]